MVRKSLLAAALVFCVGPTAWAQVKLDADLPSYKATVGVSGQMKTVGSDSMNNLLQKWTEKFREYYKGVRAEVEGQGSSTAMPALIAGSASFGPMSRDPKDSEVADFEKKFGYKPTMLPTSIDLMGVYVHIDNPVKELSLPQLDAIFSKTRKLGAKEAIQTWGQVGLEGEFKDAHIAMFGRNAASGTYGYFKEVALGKGDFSETVNEQAGSATVVQSVGENKFAIGYSGLGYKTAAVKAVPLSKKDGGKAISPTPENAYSGEYPLARYLYLSVNYKPNSKLEPLRAEFIKFVFSKEGQQIVIDEGYFPVDAKTAAKVLESVGLKSK